MQDKFKKAREEAEDATTDDTENPKENDRVFPKRFDNFIKFARD